MSILLSESIRVQPRTDQFWSSDKSRRLTLVLDLLLLLCVYHPSVFSWTDKNEPLSSMCYLWYMVISSANCKVNKGYHCSLTCGYSFLVGGFNPSEKYGFVSWYDDIPNWMESLKSIIKAMFQTTNLLFIRNETNPSEHLWFFLYVISSITTREKIWQKIVPPNIIPKPP